MNTEIIVLGSSCIIGNAITLLTLAKLWDVKAHHIKRLNALLAGSIGTMPTLLFVSLFLLMGNEREKNIEQKGYEKGIQQQWQQRIDTVYVPVKAK